MTTESSVPKAVQQVVIEMSRKVIHVLSVTLSYRAALHQVESYQLIELHFIEWINKLCNLAPPTTAQALEIPLITSICSWACISAKARHELCCCRKHDELDKSCSSISFGITSTMGTEIPFRHYGCSQLYISLLPQ